MSVQFTVEFNADNLEQLRELHKELLEKYNITLRKPKGVSISSWKTGPIYTDDSEDEAS